MSEVFGMPLTGNHLSDDEIVTDVLVIAKVVRVNDADAQPVLRVFFNEGLDWITQIGMMQIAADNRKRQAGDK